EGAAPVFGPQKGARPEEIPQLAAGLTRLAELWSQAGRPELGSVPMGGAAGGLGAGLAFFAKAELKNGAAWVLERAGVDAAMVHERHDIEGLDAAILMHPKVWEASGHVAGFTDPLVDCKQCKNRFRADDPKIKGTPGQPDAQCPVCGSKGTLTAPRQFNLMFKTFMGPVEEQAAVIYLRPETAQGIYVNYLNVLQSSRQKVPFGI